MYDELIELLSRYSVLEIENALKSEWIGAGIAADAIEERLAIDKAKESESPVKTYNPNSFHRYSGYEDITVISCN